MQLTLVSIKTFDMEMVFWFTAMADAMRGSGLKERGMVSDMKDIQMVIYIKVHISTIKLKAKEHIIGERVKVILETGTKE